MQATATLIHEMRPKILERRARLQAAARTVSAEYVNDLLAEVDATLRRIEDGSYGICESCHETIEADRLERNPFERFCLDHLNAVERQAHEQDMSLATQIQARLLPARDIKTGVWETHYRYQPAGVVGGDYCEIIPSGDRSSMFFAVGDVTGKGVAASLLMTHLSAIFRSLLSLELPLAEVMTRANRLFCESTPATHYATLVAARASDDHIELCNAGHCRPLLLRGSGTEQVDSTGLPLGLFCDARYTIRQIGLHAGDSLVLYSDGITEAQDPDGNTFDEDRLMRVFEGQRDCDSVEMADRILRDVTAFCEGRSAQDDRTLLIVRRRA
jgi:sigma-B regulation protein RsbU (phosphoserine phosphatase)